MENPKSKIQNPKSKLLAIALVILLTVGVGIYFFDRYQPTPTIETTIDPYQSAAIFVPKRAPLTASLLINPDRLQSAGESIGLPGRKLRDRLNKIEKDLLVSEAIDYKRDIQPWAGEEITLAVTTPDLDRDSSNGKQMGMLIAIATKDAQLSKEFLQLFWQKQAVAGVKLAFENYRGAKLIYTKTNRLNPPGLFQPVATALVGDKYLLFANHAKVLREAINNVQAPNLNLISNPKFQKAFSKMKQNPIASLFIDFGEWELQIRDWSVLVANKPKLGLGLSIDDRKLVAETAWLSEGGNLPAFSPRLSEPVTALQYIPAASSLVAASRDLRSLWNDISTTAADNWLLSNSIESPLTELEQKWEIDLSEDIFSWARGEYALARSHDGEWIFVAERSPETDAAIARLDAKAAAAGYSIGSFSLRDRTVSAWTELTTIGFENNNQKERNAPAIKAQAKALHAAAGKYEIFTSSLAAMDEALKASEGDNFLTGEDFQKNIAFLPSKNNGYFYLDWSANRQFLESQFSWLKVAEFWNKLLFDSWRSLTFTSTGGEVGLRRAKAIVTFSN